MSVHKEEQARTQEKKEDFLQLLNENKRFVVGKDTGTLHFHNETLRHNSGEFTLNRIFSVRPQGNRIVSCLKEKRKKKKMPKVDRNCKQLIEATNKILDPRYSVVRTSLRVNNPKTMSNLRGKSKVYLNLSSRF